MLAEQNILSGKWNMTETKKICMILLKTKKNICKVKFFRTCMDWIKKTFSGQISLWNFSAQPRKSCPGPIYEL